MTEEKVYGEIEKDNFQYEIRHASNEELLEAAIYFYQQGGSDEFLAYQRERWMRLGFALAQEDAWEKVAPAWLKDWREHIEVPI